MDSRSGIDRLAYVLRLEYDRDHTHHEHKERSLDANGIRVGEARSTERIG